MNKNKKIMLIILLSIIIFIITILIFTFINIKEVNKKGNVKFYTMGNDKIPSITSVVGKRKTNNISYDKSKNITTKKYKYTNIKDVKSDIDNYINELKNNNFINTTSIDLSKENGLISFATLSSDKEYIIILNITYNTNSYIIELKKGIGTLTEFN